MIDVKNKKIGFIGAGNMAEALINGIIKSGIPGRNILVSDINSKRLNYISKKFRIKKVPCNTAVVKASNIVFIAVKPHHVEEVLKKLSNSFNDKKLLVSIAAGIKTSKIEKYVRNIPVIRVMPNTPALLGLGAIAISRGKYAKFADMKTAEKLLKSCGVVVTVGEGQMDAVTAISGSGPAYIFYIAEAMRKTAVKMGLSEKNAKDLVNQTLLGASNMLIETGEEPEMLRKKVTSKGGTTEAAFKYLLKKGFANIFQKAILSAKNRAGKIS
ncbi:MAG: pyrroline-5-carboxylate reductase [Elusimicrobia bacterium]|nr:pyrroline-5-carboxylate reductase [Elusimicrobiota bacterium]